ncbi:hypothetical protein [Virgibacillus sp. YIM 98842]|uniref:hypothetical protein n=1 Tax=Virgibacillus sp. YIM 98842 TaxID=2663533 RepID=UPI0013DA6EC3|nr:hypothetical protein [Virgibacillus sp. YIM 98842]
MRTHEKQWSSVNNKEVFGINLHRFMEMEEHANSMEIAQEFGLSIGEVNRLKKKINRT